MMKPIRINEKYRTLYEQPENIRYYIITGGRGSGKSFGVGLWSNLKTYEPKCRILYTRYTLTAASISIIPEFVEKIELLNALPDFHVTRKEIINKRTKSDILFRGIKTSSGNQTANLKSLQGVSVWILDEAEELEDEEIFDKIDLSIRSKESNNIVVLIMNPALMDHWVYQRFFEDAGVQPGYNGVKGNACYIHSDYRDNISNLSDSFLQQINRIKEKDPSRYEHEILGGWLEHKKGVVFNKRQLNYYNGEELNTENVIVKLGSVDPAGSGTDSCCAIIGILIDNKIYIHDVVFTKEGTLSNIPMVAGLLNNYRPEYVRVESNMGNGMYLNQLNDLIHDDIMATGIRATTRKHDRILSMAGFIISHCVFREDIEHGSDYFYFMKELTQYMHNGKSEHDDAPDALEILTSMAKNIYPHLWEKDYL